MGVLESLTSTRAQKILRTYYTCKSKLKPLPPLPDGTWDGVCAPGPHYTVGFGRAAFTPDDVQSKIYWLAGYGTNRPAASVHSDICASAVWLDDNTGRGALLLVSLDCVGFLRADVLPCGSTWRTSAGRPAAAR